MSDHLNWLSAEDWKWVQDTMPIACCDVVPVRLAADGRTISHVGLIHRETPHQGRRWCIVGGRMRRNESLAAAATRQLQETLGASIRFSIADNRQPDHVAQYFSDIRPGELHDPRQHAVTSVFIVPIEGDITPGGEAIAFEWFDLNNLPDAQHWGFGQDRIVAACLQKQF